MYSVANLTDRELLIDNIFEFQNRNRYTDCQMAEKIGCSRQTYGRIEKVWEEKKEVAASPEFLWKAMQFLLPLVNEEGSSVIKHEGNNNGRRYTTITRQTKETNISVELNLDGSGKYEINNGNNMFDHLLSQLAKHGKFDMKIKASGDDQHHVAEDVAICLGQAFGKALGDKRGIVRMADATVPMDDALASVVVDISGRGYAHLDMAFSNNDMSGFSTDLVRHFLESFATEARLNLHARVVSGNNDHHKAEALFKALGRALDKATRIDERISGELPSTKEFLEG